MNKTITLLVFSCLAVDASAATLAHNYQLTSSLNDTLGGPALLSDGGTQGPSGYSFAANQGLNVGSALGNPGDYSILMDFSFASLAGYRKILDFKDRTSDNGLYNLGGTLDFFPVAAGGVVFSADTLARVVLTRDAATNTVTGYVNGALQLTFNDSSSLATFSGANNIIRFFEDDSATSGEASAGLATKIQIYDGALSAADAERLGGPSAIPTDGVPEPTALALVGLGLLSLGVVRRIKT